MGPLPFNMAIMEFLADHRSPVLTAVFRAFSDLGEVQGYLVIITLIYVAFDKRLAIRLSILVSVSMSLNHVMKILIRNPRPFIRQGDYMQKWAVPADNARDLATEYSTPSGHAMAAGAFYPYLMGCVRSPYVRVAAALAMLLIGLSRPYLGVHYVEDIVLGWAIGLGVGLAALRYGEQVDAAWSRLRHSRQIAIAVAASLMLWAATIALNGWRIDGEPRAFLGYAGTFTGVIIARPLERRLVDFDPKSSSAAVKALRFLLTLALAFLTLEGLGKAFAAIVGNYSLAGYGLQYLRHVAVSLVAILIAPWIFTRLGLARTNAAAPASPNDRAPGLRSGTRRANTPEVGDRP